MTRDSQFELRRPRAIVQRVAVRPDSGGLRLKSLKRGDFVIAFDHRLDDDGRTATGTFAFRSGPNPGLPLDVELSITADLVFKRAPATRELFESLAPQILLKALYPHFWELVTERLGRFGLPASVIPPA